MVLHMLANVQQATIKPIIAAAIAPGSLVHTDEYSIYARLPAWATGTRRSATLEVSMPATRTGTASARSTSTQSKASGHCCAPGCARIAAFRKTSYRFTSASSNSCTMRADAAKPCSAPWSPAWLCDEPTTPEPNKSHAGLSCCLRRLLPLPAGALGSFQDEAYRPFSTTPA